MKLFLEFAPLIAFFIVYKVFGLIPATGTLIILTGISVILLYFIQKKLPIMPIASAVIVGIFGGLTILLHNEIFIKLKPTIVNTLFAVILLIGAAGFKKGLLKYLMGEALPLSDTAWLTFSKRWGVFLLFLAVVNEIVWRNFSTDFWVQFKVFGMFSMSILFTLSQIPFIQKHMVSEQEKTQK